MKDRAQKSIKNSGSLLGAGAITSILASLCCITPVLALISGAAGVASVFSWLEPLRPYLIGITILALGFAWYQKLKPKSANEIQCECDEEVNKPFIQRKTFLGIVTVFAALMLTFPNYAHIFFPSNEPREVLVVNSSDLQMASFAIKGMTCNGCASHVENEVNKLPGIIAVKASYENSSATVEFDQSKVSLSEIEDAINKTGYKVVPEI